MFGLFYVGLFTIFMLISQHFCSFLIFFFAYLMKFLLILSGSHGYYHKRILILNGDDSHYKRVSI